MTILLLATPESFPHPSTTWCILPLRFSGQSVIADYLLSEADSMDDMTGPAPPTGVDHWEEQRRKWTKGFAERMDIKKEDV